MQLKSILLLAFSAATVRSWKIARGQPDGVYRVDAKTDGTINHVLLETPPSSERSIHAPRTPISRHRRDLVFPESNTCLTYSLIAADNNAAFNGLSEICNTHTFGATALGTYSISNDVVVYWCNYPTQPCDDCGTAVQTCSAEDLSLSMQSFLSPACGSFVAGWATWARQAYGQESVSKDPNFCGNGLFNS